jgi:hypothetical protein
LRRGRIYAIVRHQIVELCVAPVASRGVSVRGHRCGPFVRLALAAAAETLVSARVALRSRANVSALGFLWLVASRASAFF